MKHRAPTKKKETFLDQIITSKNPHAAVQIKKETLFGFLIHQILFQWKEVAMVPWIVGWPCNMNKHEIYSYLVSISAYRPHLQIYYY